MNALAAEGFAIVGGLLEGTADALLAFCAKDKDEVCTRLKADPWGEDMLRLTRINLWQLRLGRDKLPCGTS